MMSKIKPRHESPAEEYKNKCLSSEELNIELKALVLNGTPTSAAKMGMVEAMSVYHYLLRKEKGHKTEYHGIGQLMFVNAGIFPPTVESFDQFNETYLSYFSDLDLFGMWIWGPEPCGEYEKLVYDEYTKDASLCFGGDWMPFFREKPWTAELKGKRVLVISPFANTITKQYEKREKIWESNPDILPSFDLKTIKCPLSAGISDSPFTDWTEGLHAMEDIMDKTDFDVCFVGAGAWGLPLAVHARRLGKIGIHGGGDTQLLFGIKGKRWDDNPDISDKLYNEHWVRPSRNETPTNRKFIEDGCYW
jgi:hypothetical protein